MFRSHIGRKHHKYFRLLLIWAIIRFGKIWEQVKIRRSLTFELEFAQTYAIAKPFSGRIRWSQTIHSNILPSCLSNKLHKRCLTRMVDFRWEFPIDKFHTISTIWTYSYTQCPSQLSSNAIRYFIRGFTEFYLLTELLKKWKGTTNSNTFQ